MAGADSASPPPMGANSEQRTNQRPLNPVSSKNALSGGSGENSSAEQVVHPDARTDETRTGTSPHRMNHRGEEAVAAAVPVETEVAGMTSSTGNGEAGRPRPCRAEFEAAQGQATVPAGLLWSDFGGGREASDADAEETASREFAEESFGMFHGVRLDGDSVARSQVSV